MKNYELKVNLNEGKKFVSAEWHTIATAEAVSKEEAEKNYSMALYGVDNGVKFTDDVNRYLGMKVKAFVA